MDYTQEVDELEGSDHAGRRKIKRQSAHRPPKDRSARRIPHRMAAP